MAAVGGTGSDRTLMPAISSTRGDKPDHVRDQYGFAVGGPIIKNKTFFFVDFEKIRQQDPSNLEGIVPTDLERTGDFSQSPANSTGSSNPDTLKLESTIRVPETKDLRHPVRILNFRAT